MHEKRSQAVVPSAEPSPLDLEELYHRYADRLLNLIYRMTYNEEVARDLLQDVFLRVHERQHQFRGQSSVYTWLYRIAVNQVLNYLKREKRRRWVQLLDLPVWGSLRGQTEPRASSLASSQNTPEQAAMNRDRERIVWQVIQQLPEKLRIPFILYRYEGLSYREIADVMEISLSAVETRLHRAKKKFIELIEPWLDQI